MSTIDREVRNLRHALTSLPFALSDGHNVKVDFNTFDIQWSNEDEVNDDAINEIAGEQKDDFKRIADSIEALARYVQL